MLPIQNVVWFIMGGTSKMNSPFHMQQRSAGFYSGKGNRQPQKKANNSSRTLLQAGAESASLRSCFSPDIFEFEKRREPISHPKRLVGIEQPQKMYFRANCKTRGDWAVVIIPNVVP